MVNKYITCEKCRERFSSFYRKCRFCGFKRRLPYKDRFRKGKKEKYCVVCKKLIPESRKKAFPKRKIITCSKKCGRINGFGYVNNRKEYDKLRKGRKQ